MYLYKHRRLFSPARIVDFQLNLRTRLLSNHCRPRVIHRTINKRHAFVGDRQSATGQQWQMVRRDPSEEPSDIDLASPRASHCHSYEEKSKFDSEPEDRRKARDKAESYGSSITSAVIDHRGPDLPYGPMDQHSRHNTVPRWTSALPRREPPSRNHSQTDRKPIPRPGIR